MVGKIENGQYRPRSLFSHSNNIAQFLQPTHHIHILKIRKSSLKSKRNMCVAEKYVCCKKIPSPLIKTCLLTMVAELFLHCRCLGYYLYRRHCRALQKHAHPNDLVFLYYIAVISCKHILWQLDRIVLVKIHHLKNQNQMFCQSLNENQRI